MLPDHATLNQTRSYLEHELKKIYPHNEAVSMARLIMEHAGFSPTTILMEPSSLPGSEILAQIKEIVAEIHKGRPLQYILGYTYFSDLKIIVNEKVLIPRPETEEMVYLIRQGTPQPPARIVDLGTGSGCIALALKQSYPHAEVFGMDFSKSALEVATHNSLINQLSVHWIQGDLTSRETWKLPGTFDLMVSNPPYVMESERVLMQVNVLDFEPNEALFVPDSDPLLFFSAIASMGKEKLASGGILWVEINERLGAETARVFEIAGYDQVTIIKDLHEKERFIRAVR
jgi:release factor glutamine methyltransferase